MSKEVFQIGTAADLRPIMNKAWHVACAMIEESDRKGLKVTVETASRRSLQANNLMWIRLGELAAQTDWHGIKLAPDEWKDLLSAGLTKSKVVPNIEGTGFVILGQRTSQMTIQAMNDLITLIEAFGSERNVKFSIDPREIA